MSTSAPRTRLDLSQDEGRALHAGLQEALAAGLERDSESLMIAFRRSDVADLNRRARERMRAAGRLHGDEIEIGGVSFSAGDQVVIRHGSRRLGVVNGDRGMAIAVDPERRSVTVDLRA